MKTIIVSLLVLASQAQASPTSVSTPGTGQSGNHVAVSQTTPNTLVGLQRELETLRSQLIKASELNAELTAIASYQLTMSRVLQQLKTEMHHEEIDDLKAWASYNYLMGTTLYQLRKTSDENLLAEMAASESYAKMMRHTLQSLQQLDQ